MGDKVVPQNTVEPFDEKKSTDKISSLQVKLDKYNAIIEKSGLSDDDKRALRRLNGELGSNLGSIAVREQNKADQEGYNNSIKNYNDTTGKINSILQKQGGLTPGQISDYKNTVNEYNQEVGKLNDYNDKSKIDDNADPVGLAKQISDLSKPEKIQVNKPLPMGMGLSSVTTDQDYYNPENKKAADKITEHLTKLGYDKNFIDAVKDIPKAYENNPTYGDKALSELYKNNPIQFNRTVASLKWQDGLVNAMDAKSTDIPAEDRAADHQLLLNLQSGEGKDEATKQSDFALKERLIRKYVDNPADQKKLLDEARVDAMNTFGTEHDSAKWNNHPMDGLNGAQSIAMNYLDNTDKEKAIAFRNALIDVDKSEVSKSKWAQDAFDQKSKELEELGYTLQYNSAKEKEDKAQQHWREAQTTEENAEAESAYSKAKIQTDNALYNINNLKNLYPNADASDIDLAAQNVLGKGSGVGSAGSAVFANFAKTGKGILDIASSPFQSKESNNLDVLKTIGMTESLKPSTSSPDNAQVYQNTEYVFDKDLKAKIDAVKKENISDEAKMMEVKYLLSQNKNQWRLQQTDGHFNVGINSIASSFLHLGAALAPYVFQEAMTGGGATAGVVRHFMTTLGAVATTSYTDEVASAAKNGSANPNFDAYVNVGINTLAFTVGGMSGKAEELVNKIRGIAGKETALGKIISKMDDGQILSELSNPPAKLKEYFSQLWKSTKGASMNAVKSAVPFQAVMAAKDLSQGATLNDDFVKSQVAQLLNFTLFQTVTGSMMGYKSLRSESKEALYLSGKNSDEALDALKKGVENGTINKEAAKRIEENINIAKDIYDKTPMIDAKGKPLTDANASELMYLKIKEGHIEDILKKDLPDDVVARMEKNLENVQDDIKKIYKDNVPDKLGNPFFNKTTDPIDVDENGNPLGENQFTQKTEDKKGNTVYTEQEYNEAKSKIEENRDLDNKEIDEKIAEEKRDKKKFWDVRVQNLEEQRKQQNQYYENRLRELADEMPSTEDKGDEVVAAKEPLKTYTAEQLKNNPELLKEDPHYHTGGYENSFEGIATDAMTLGIKKKDAKVGDIVSLQGKKYVIDGVDKGKKGSISLIRVDEDGNLLRRKDLSKKEAMASMGGEGEQEQTGTKKGKAKGSKKTTPLAQVGSVTAEEHEKMFGKKTPISHTPQEFYDVVKKLVEVNYAGVENNIKEFYTDIAKRYFDGEQSIKEVVRAALNGELKNDLENSDHLQSVVDTKTQLAQKASGKLEDAVTDTKPSTNKEPVEIYKNKKATKPGDDTTSKDEKFFDTRVNQVHNHGKPLSSFKEGDKVFFASDYSGNNHKIYVEGTYRIANGEHTIERFSDHPYFKKYKNANFSADTEVVAKPEGEPHFPDETFRRDKEKARFQYNPNVDYTNWEDREDEVTEQEKTKNTSKKSTKVKKRELAKEDEVANDLLAHLGISNIDTAPGHIQPQFKTELNENLSQDEAENVAQKFDEKLNDPNFHTEEVVNMDDKLGNGVPTQEITVDPSDGRPESKLMAALRVPLNFIFGKTVGIGMSDTLTTGERTADVMDADGNISSAKIREEGGIGYPFKSLIDLIKGTTDKVALGWAAVGKGAASSMVNAAKKADKISGKELKQHYFDNLDLSEDEKERLNKAIPDDKEFGLVSIYKMGEDGIKSNEAYAREAFRQIDTKLSDEEKAEFFKLAEKRLNELEWTDKDKHLSDIKNAKNFVELEQALHGSDSKLSLGAKADIVQKIFLSTEDTESSKDVNPIGNLLNSKGISIESIARELEEPVMRGVDKGQPMILLAIDPDSKPIEDKGRERHNNYPYGVQGFPVGVFDRTTQFHHLSPEMMDTFVKTATNKTDEKATLNGEPTRVSIYQESDGRFYADNGKGADKSPIVDKKGNRVSGESKEALIKNLGKNGYKISKDIKKEPYSQKINGTTFANLLQKAKKGIINIFENTQLSAQEKLVKVLQKSFPGIVVEMSGEEYTKQENSFKAQKLFNKNGETYGFVKDGRVYLNPNMLNNNTPIHEFGHIWNAFAKNYRTEIYNKGVELVTGTKYHDFVLNDFQYQKLIKAEFGDDALVKDKVTGKFYVNDKSENAAAIKDMVADEALAKAIGDKGELFVNEAQKRNFTQWVKDMFDAVKKVLGFDTMSAEQFQNLTLQQFTDSAVKELLGGKKIDDISSEDLSKLSEGSPKFSTQESMEDKIRTFIDSQRQKGISDDVIQKGIEKVADQIGLDPSKIKELMTPAEKPVDIPESADEDYIKMANAINDVLLTKVSGVEGLNTIISKLGDTDLESIVAKVKAKVKVNPNILKETRDRLLVTGHGSEMDQAILMYDLASLNGRLNDLQDQIIASTDPKEKAELQKEILKVQNDIYDNGTANRSIGRSASTIFRLRQLYVNRDLSKVEMRKQFMSSKGVNELSEEQEQMIQEAYDKIKASQDKLKKAKDALIKSNEENARVVEENSKLKELLEEANKKKKSERSQKTQEIIDKSNERISQSKDKLKKLGGNLSAGFNPEIAVELTKIAAEKVYQGITKFDELVKNIYDDIIDVLPGFTEEDVINHILAKKNKNGVLEPTLLSAKYIKLRRDGYDSEAAKRENIKLYEQAQNELAINQYEWQKSRRIDMMKNQSFATRLADGILRFQRFNILAYPSTFVKLGGAVANAFLLKPLRFAVGKLASLVTPRSVANKQTIWGDPKFSSLAKYYSNFFKSLSPENFKQQMKGIDTKELLYGNQGMYDEFDNSNSWMDMPGRSHGYIKSFIKNAEFGYAHEQQFVYHMTKMEEISKKLNDVNITEEEEKELQAQYDSHDVTNEEVIDRINRMSLEHAKWSILMNDNRIASFVNNMTRSGVGGKLLRTELPIVKVPFNWVGRALATQYGLVRLITGRSAIEAKAFGGEAFPGIPEMLMKGTENLTEKQADLIGRTMQLGMIGGAFFVLGYMDRKNIIKNKDGSYEIHGVHVAKNLIHIPEYESILSGASAGQKHDGDEDYLNAYAESQFEIVANNPFVSFFQYSAIAKTAMALGEEAQDKEAKNGYVDKFTQIWAKKFADMSTSGILKQVATSYDTSEKPGGFNPFGTIVQRVPSGGTFEKAYQQFVLGIPYFRSKVVQAKFKADIINSLETEMKGNAFKGQRESAIKRIKDLPDINIPETKK